MTQITVLFFFPTETVARTVDDFFERDSSKSFRRLTIFSERIARAVRTDANFLEQIARAVRTVSLPVRTANERLMNGYPFKNS